MIVKGKTFKYGNNIDTDVIIPARYLNTSEPDELAKYCMEDIDKNFSKKVQKGDIIVGCKNFGCGSSREHAPIAIKASGISCVIAESFGRIFYRNSFNIGLPIIESAEASRQIEKDDEVEIDFETGKIHNITKNEVYMAAPFPEFIRKIIYSDGLVGYVKDKIYNKMPEEKI